MTKKENSNEEIVYEEGVDGTPSVDLDKKNNKLKIELESCKNEKQEYLDGWQRSQADFVNFKKRAEEDKKSFVKYASEDFIMEILPVVDSFDQAFKDKEAWEKADKNWRIGIEYIYSQLKGVLENKGVVEINPINEEFNAELHQSVEMIKVEDKKDDGKIVEVVQKGYKIGDKTIRYPGVKVAEK